MKQYLNHLLVLFLIAASSIYIAFAGRPGFNDAMPVCGELPERIGDANGASVLFCQNEACMKSFAGTEGELTRCAVCGGAVDSVSLPEKRVLPRDTIIRRRFYIRPQNESFLVTIVTSGRERTSIHRPEMCLEGQGYRIVGQRVTDVPLKGGGHLEVRVLDSRKNISMPDGTGRETSWYYAYWFTGGGRETARHYERMIRSAWDNIVHGTSYRWAYISVMVQKSAELHDGQEDGIREIIQELYPALMMRK